MAKPIMIQGTMSGAGKSYLTAAICRMLRQDGHTVAPFKSQNMALNSYVTESGEEIGRAQALQAFAAGIEPSADMNPILLKPTTDKGSQVIVNGRVRADMRAREYFRHKKELIPDIMDAYRRLSDKYEYIVIEGAGSPVELNLKRDDIVNMGIAKMTGAPVILAGDIDRGGIFAQLQGTLSLLDEDERDYVKGLYVNRFRGDISLFSDGVEILERICGKKVLGVVPFVANRLDDEDSLSERLGKTAVTGKIDIAVIHLPKISNFTDMDVFSQYSGVSVRYVSEPSELLIPDMIVIPGTKSTLADLQWMRTNGMDRQIMRCVGLGVPVFGICGGYQIMGRRISDPDNAEGGGSADGLGILGIDTVFGREKTTTRTSGRFGSLGGFFSCLSGKAFHGYEVHMGTSDEGSLTDIGGSISGNAAGCYVHGIFDDADVSHSLVSALYERKGLVMKETGESRSAYLDRALDEAAESLRRSTDMDMFYRIIEEGI